MPSVRETRDIDAAPERVIEVVRDIAAYPRWHAEMTRVVVREVDADGRPGLAELTAAALGFTTRYTIRITYPAALVVRTSLVTGDLITRQEQRFEARPRGAGTELAYTIDLAAVVPLPGAIVRRLMAGSIAGLLDGIRDQAQR